MKTDAERFWEKVDKSGDCWLWTAARRNGKRYGGFGVAGKQLMAHRYSWELGCHRCDNPPCVNPAHLFLGTNEQNMADMVAKGRSVHRFGEDNPDSRLTWDDVELIRLAGNTLPVSKTAIGKAFGVSDVMIGKILRRENWVHP